MVWTSKYKRFGFDPDSGSLDMPNEDKWVRFEVGSTADLTVYLLERRRQLNKLLKDGKIKDRSVLSSDFFATLEKTYKDAVASRLKHSVASPYTFFERLSYFWSNHFAIASKAFVSGMMISPTMEADAIRPHIGGKFSDMLHAATKHPALIWSLGQRGSFGPKSPQGLLRGRGLNENYAREIMELHTLGVGGGYTQGDVEEMALLLTGLNVSYDTGLASFEIGRAQPGYRTVLGKNYGGYIRNMDDIDQVLDDLAVHPSTARYVSEKLAIHFVSDEPPKALIDAMAQRFLDTDGDLPAVYETMIGMSEELVPEARKYRQPLDFIISALRAVDAPDIDYTYATGNPYRAMGMMKVGASVTLPDLTSGALDAMGNRLWAPPGPDGWPALNNQWLTADALVKRIAWTNKGALLFDGSAADFLDRACGNDVLPRTQRIVADTVDNLTAIRLILMSPDFNYR